MMMICFLATTSLLFLLKGTNAFPSGAGSCAGAMPAVFGFHLDTTNGRTVRSATLDELGIVVLLGTTVLNVSVVSDFPIGQDLQISVSTPVESPYKGVLVRLQAPTDVNTTAALLPGTNTAFSSQCMAPIIGITHTNSSLKTNSTGTIRFDTEVFNVTLGITVVFVNNATTSIYGFGEFKVNFRAAQTPVTAPIVPPTPVAPPVVPPVPVPAPKAPVVPVPVPAPKAPTTVPVKPPTDCGLLGFSLFCPRTQCGWLGRRLGLCE